jgi:hypothetical protein
MHINSISDFRRAFRIGPYTSLGGYPCYFVLSDGEALSFKAAKAERRQLLEALNAYRYDRREQSGWRPVALEINWEDETLYCAHTSEPIESAYGED